MNPIDKQMWNEDDSKGVGMFWLQKSMAAEMIKNKSSGDVLNCFANGNPGPVPLNWEPSDATEDGTYTVGGAVHDASITATFDDKMYSEPVMRNYASFYFMYTEYRAQIDENGKMYSNGEEMMYPGTKRFVSETGAYTIGGFYRLMYEWASLYDDPFNDRGLFTMWAKRFMDQMPLNDEIVAEIVSWPDQQVYRYLKGEVGINVESRHPGPYPLSDNFKAWFMQVREIYKQNNIVHLVELLG